MIKNPETAIAAIFQGRFRPVTIAVSIALVVLVAVVTIQRSRKATEILIGVSVKVCPPSSSDCYQLRVPNADILVRGAHFAKGLETGASGSVSIIVPGAGEYSISVISFVIQDRELSGFVTAKIHETTRIELVGSLVADALGP